MGYKDKPTLGQAFRAWREYHHYLLKDAAAITHVPLSTIRRLENNESAPQIRNLARIAKALDMSTDELIARYFSDTQKDQ
ncbi:helix-turn-helix domain-containing protein [Weissella paramesenteroides]